jgi:hypothetical protein
MLVGFGVVIALIKGGFKCARKGWNGKDMFIFMVKGSQFSFPLRFTVNRAPLNEIYPEGTEITYRSHIDMRTAVLTECSATVYGK